MSMNGSMRLQLIIGNIVAIFLLEFPLLTKKIAYVICLVWHTGNIAERESTSSVNKNQNSRNRLYAPREVISRHHHRGHFFIQQLTQILTECIVSATYHTMAKTKAAKRKSSTTWTGADHSDRTAKRIASLQKKQRKKQQKLEVSTNHDTHHHEPESKRGRLSSHVPSDTYKRTHLAHDNEYKIELSKLRLATSQIQRQLTENLLDWIEKVPNPFRKIKK